MKQKMNQDKKLPKFLFPMLYASLTVFILVGFTFSWLQRQATPSVSGNNITIQTAGSLAFAFTDNQTTDASNFKETINLRECSGGVFENLVFSPVSNYTGKSDDFFKIDYSQDLTDAHFVKIEQNDNVSASKIAADNGYFEISFQLIANTDTTSQKSKYIYLSSDSYIRINPDSQIKDDPSGAFRVSITDHSHNDKTYIMENGVESETMPAAEDGLSYVCDTSIPAKKLNGKEYLTYYKTNRAIKNGDSEDYAAVSNSNYYWYYDHDKEGKLINYNTESGTPIYQRAGSSTFRKTSENIYPLSHFFDPFVHETSGGSYVYGEDGLPQKTDQIDTDTENKRYLLEMKPGGYYNLTLRVWLEGEDNRCIDEKDFSILGSSIDMSIIFACKDADSTK